MSFDHLRNKIHPEDKIKHHLCLIDLEENEDHQVSSRHLYDLQERVRRKNSNEHDITDWMNNQKSMYLMQTTKR